MNASAVLKSPEDAFYELPGYAYEPKFLSVDGMDMHYVEAGPKGGWPVLLLHGVPTWSYLYRHMIPVLAEAGLRVIAPDLIGFGRSDKPSDPTAHTYAKHVEWMHTFIREKKLQALTLVCQDWGGLIGLRVVADSPERFRGVVVANTGLPTGKEPLSHAFQSWQRLAKETQNLDIGRIVNGGCERSLGEYDLDAYNAPFPDESFKAAVRAFPQMVPTSTDMPGAKENQEAWERLSQLKIPVLTTFSDKDQIFAGGDLLFQQRIPGAQGQDHTTIAGAGHFLQEDRGPELAHEIINFIADSEPPRP